MGVTISGVQSYTAIQTQFATNRIRREVNVLREAVGTGERINRATDDGAAFAVAQSSRSTLAARGALIQQLETSKLVLERGLSAAQLMQVAAGELRGVLTRLADGNQTPEVRQLAEDDYKRVVGQFYEAWAVDRAGPLDPNGIGIRSTLRDGYAYVNGQQNIEVLSGIDGAQFDIANDSGTQFDGVEVYIRLTDQTSGIASPARPPVNFAPSKAQAIAMLQNDASSPDLTTASGNTLYTFAEVRNQVDGITAKLGNDYRGVSNRLEMERALSSKLLEEIGTLVDTDMAKASARLAALSAKEDLAIRQVGVANSSVELVLGLIPDR